MNNTKAVIFIKCRKGTQNLIQNYFSELNLAETIFVNSLVEFKNIIVKKQTALLITDNVTSNSVPTKFVTQYKQKASRKETPVLYLTDKPLQNLKYSTGKDAGYYDILQLPVPKEIFLNKIKLLLQFHKLQYSDQQFKDFFIGKKNQKKGQNSLEQQIQKRTEQLTNEIEEHFKTNIALQEKVNKIDEAYSFLELLIDEIPLPVFIKNDKSILTKIKFELQN